MDQIKKEYKLLYYVDDKELLISMIMSHYVYDLTHLRGYGSNREIFSFGFLFK